MPSRRGTAIAFGAMSLAVAVIFVSFVFPGYLNGSCVDERLTTQIGVRSFCSETVLLGLPSQSCNSNGTSFVACGPPVVTLFKTSTFTLFTMIPLSPPSGFPMGLNITVVEKGGLTEKGLLSCTLFHAVDWTTPDGTAGVLVNDTRNLTAGMLPVVLLAEG